MGQIPEPLFPEHFSEDEKKVALKNLMQHRAIFLSSGSALWQPYAEGGATTVKKAMTYYRLPLDDVFWLWDMVEQGHIFMDCDGHALLNRKSGRFAYPLRLTAEHATAVDQLLISRVIFSEEEKAFVQALLERDVFGYAVIDYGMRVSAEFPPKGDLSGLFWMERDASGQDELADEATLKVFKGLIARGVFTLNPQPMLMLNGLSAHTLRYLL